MSRKTNLPVMVVGLVMLLTSVAAGEPLKKLAVSEIAARRGVDPVLAKVVEDFLVVEIAKTGDYEVIGRDDISRLIAHEEERQQLGCYDDACLAEIGGALGVDYLVGGSLDKVGESMLINLKVLDISEAKVVARDGERLKGANEEQVLDGMTSLFERVFTKGATLTGEAKPKPNPEAAPRPAPEAAPAVASPAEPAPAPGTAPRTTKSAGGSDRVWTWVVGAVGLALAGASAGLLVVADQRFTEADDLADKVRPPQQENVTYDEIRDTEDEAGTLETAGWAMLGVGVAALGTAVVLFFVEGGDDEGATAVAPWLGDGIGGVTAEVRF